jgi:hypothetical protein
MASATDFRFEAASQLGYCMDYKRHKLRCAKHCVALSEVSVLGPTSPVNAFALNR